MPLERHDCEECGTTHTVCPECGSTFVTARENPMRPSPNDLVDRDHGDAEVTYTHLCWDCGWDEEVTVTVERH